MHRARKPARTIRIEDDLKARVAAAAERIGKTVAWDEAKTYLAARARGERPTKQAARKLGR